ncbi:MAG: UDP-N-acetylglucosamine--LPS N-acetylglucosamine transferase [Clostridia bacterium]|nr:UDP-N-acetylglucosamine--LPS N-acetylglucosamine transferase [Clostridia bacterium]
MDTLILSVSAGGGHMKAGEAIKECIEHKYPGARTMIVDTLRYVNPIIDKFIVGGLYLNTVKNAPILWGILYELAESGDNVTDFSKAVNKLLSVKIKNLINDFKPSVIVCTHPFPLQMLSNLKKKGKVNIPTVAILTDFATHPFWLHEHIDAYVVAHDYMKYEAVNRNLSEDIIHPFGIPISKSFLQKKDRAAILRELKLEDKLTVLMMGGSLGFGEVRDTFQSLLNSKKDLQIIAITGKNTKLKRQLEKYTEASKKKVVILSYTNRVADLMDISDLLITKPGGMTIAEALVKELPIIIISPIPGQEERNAHFLTNIGAAARILDTDNVDAVLNQIIDNPLRIKHMKEMCRFLAKPNSSENTMELLEQLVRENERINEKYS